MSVQSSVSQFSEIYNRFFNKNPEILLTSGVAYSDYDGPNVDETISYLRFLSSNYGILIQSNELNNISKSALGSLIAQIQNVNNSFTHLESNRDQNSFQNFALTIDQFVSQTRMFGIPLLALGGNNLEAQRITLQEELITLRANNYEVEQLKKEVRTLITPAIAGSLSEAFQQRRDKVYKGRLIWLAACFVLGCLASYSTFDFVHTVSSALSKPIVSAEEPQSIWIIFAIRTIVLIPLFAGFGFAFSQYRKERDYEEEYAHKAAVANSLPNYGELARDQAIRDQIVTAATSVIFSSPSEQARKVETSNAMLGGLKEVVEAMGKALAKK